MFIFWFRQEIYIFTNVKYGVVYFEGPPIGKLWARTSVNDWDLTRLMTANSGQLNLTAKSIKSYKKTNKQKQPPPLPLKKFTINLKCNYNNYNYLIVICANINSLVFLCIIIRVTALAFYITSMLESRYIVVLFSSIPPFQKNVTIFTRASAILP